MASVRTSCDKSPRSFHHQQTRQGPKWFGSAWTVDFLGRSDWSTDWHDLSNHSL